MKKRVYRVIVSLIVVVALSLSLVMGAAAQGLEGISENVIVEKVKDMLPLIYTQGISEDDDVKIGSPISTYHLDEDGGITNSDYTSYPVFINGDIKAIADVVKDDDGNVLQVSLGIDFAEELQKEVSENPETAYAVFYAEDGIYLKFQADTDNKLICLKSFMDDNGIVDVDVEGGMEIKYVESSPINSIEFDAQVPMATSTILFNTLNVSNVSNTSTTCCPAGICWAASIAIMANCHLGTSYTALQIHDRFSCLTSNYHNEEKSYIRSLGMYVGGPYYSTGSYPFCFSTLYDCIEADMLLLLDLQDYGNNVAHNVVAYGYYGNSDFSSLYFYYMDPNTGGRISSFPSTSSETVYISLSGYNYQVHCYITGY